MTLARAAVDTHAATGTVPWPIYLVCAWGLLVSVALPSVRVRELEYRRSETPVPPLPRRLLAAATAAVAVLILTAVWWAPLSPAGGFGKPRFLDFSAYGTALGATAVVLALVLFTLSPSVLRGSPLSRVAGACTGLVVGAVSITLVAVFTVVLPVDATTATVDGEAGELGTDPPATIGEIGWRWSAPGDGAVREVVPVRTGALVRTAEGVVLLDGRTGQERWRYFRSGERALGMQVSPGATSLMLTYPARDTDGEPSERLVVLETDTGEEVGQYRNPGTAPFDPDRRQDEFAPLLHRDVLTTLRRSNGQTSVAGYSPETGRERWTHEPMGDCARRDQDLTRHEIIVLFECDMDIMTGERGGRGAVRTLHGLVPSTGTWLWHTDVTMSSPSDRMWLHTSDDGHLFAFAWVSIDGLESENVVFGRNGELVARDLPDFGGITGHEGDWLFTSEGYLTWGADGAAGTYTWHGLDGDERTASAGETPSAVGERKQRIRPVPLEESLVTASSRGSGEAAETITLAVRPWTEGEVEKGEVDDGLDTVIDVTLAPAVGGVPEEQEEGLGRLGEDQAEEWVSLHTVPGAVVLARPGSSEVVGLV